MLKKIGMVLAILILAFFILLFWQKDKMEKNLTALLADSPLKVAKIELKLFPISIQLNNVDYLWNEQQRILQADNVQLDLSAFDLLSAKLRVNQIIVKQGSIRQLNQKNAEFEQLDIHLFPQYSALSVFDLFSFNLNKFIQTQPNFELEMKGIANKKINFNLKTRFALDMNIVKFSRFISQINLATPLINTKQINLSFDKGKLFIHNNKYDFTSNQVLFNQIVLDKINIKADNKELTAYIDDNIDIQIAAQNQLYSIQLKAVDLALEKWLTAFNVTPFIDGKTVLQAELISDKQNLKSANVEVNIEQGYIKNLNVLDLISQYLPINYDESMNQMNTKFDRLSSKFSWLDQRINISELDIDHKYLLIKGSGQADPLNNKCNFKTLIQPKVKNTINISLPIHLFGSCDALEYKLEIGRSFRNQLKDLIKQKWK